MGNSSSRRRHKEYSVSPDAQYFCSPCSTCVQKCNKIEHERGLKHRFKCGVWTKSKESYQNIKIPSDNLLNTISRNKVSVKDASTSMDNSEYHCVDQQLEKLSEEFFILEKDKVQNCGEHYLCKKCAFSGKTFEMLSHRLGKDGGIINQCFNMDGQEIKVLEEKLQILISLMSLCVMKQMYDLLKLISMDAVPRLIDTISHKKNEDVSDAMHSKVVKIDDTKKGDNTSVPALIETSYHDEEEVSEEPNKTQLPHDISSTTGRGIDILKQSNKQLDYTELKNDDISEESIRQASEKYFLLEEGIENIGHLFECQTCNVKCNPRAMMNHLFGRNHLSPNHMKLQSISRLEEKLSIMDFFEFVKTHKGDLVSHIQSNQLQFAKSVTRVLIRMKKSCSTTDEKFAETTSDLEVPSCAEGNSFKPPESKQKWKKDVVSSTSQRTPLNNVASSSSETTCVEQSEMWGDIEEDFSSGNRITIGDSSSLSLQEQMQNACPGRDFNDFDAECETCGSVFQILNGDVDLSYDMHVQTDPKHALATAVPIERDVRNVAENHASVKSPTDQTKSQILESKQDQAKLHNTVVKHEKQISEFNENKAKVIGQVLKLEQKFVVDIGDKYSCKLCAVVVNSGSQITHHLLSPRHMSHKWKSQHTPEELHEKLVQLKSLLAFRYAGAAVSLAISIISEFQKHLQNSLEPSVTEPSNKKSQANFYCAICKISMGVKSKPQHLKGRRHKLNSSAVFKAHEVRKSLTFSSRSLSPI